MASEFNFSDETDQAYAREHGDGKATMPVDVEFTHSEWMAFLHVAFMCDVEVPMEQVRAGGDVFRKGGTTYKATLDLRGTEAKLLAFLADPRVGIEG